MSERRVVCLGELMMDVVALLPGPLTTGSDTPAPIALHHGGSAANTASWLAALGTPVVFCGAVGEDPFGPMLVEGLRASGVVTAVDVIPDAPSGMCIVLVRPDGERTMVPSDGANDAITVAHVDQVALGPTDHLHVSGYSLFGEGSRPAALRALEHAVSVGATVSVDASSSALLLAHGIETFLGWMPSGTILLANETEGQVLSGSRDPRSAAVKLARRTGTAVVKCGALGAFWATGDRVAHVRTKPAAVLDTTGAGDAFGAGLLAALARGEDLATAVEEGNRVGGLAVTRVGGRP